MKIPPHNKQAEIEVLAAILNRNSNYDEITDIITPDSFFFESNKILFYAYEKILKSNVLDIVTLMDYLKKNDLYDRIDWLKFLSEIMEVNTLGRNIKTHALLIQEKYIKRTLIEKGRELLEKGYDEVTDPLNLLIETTKDLNKLLDYKSKENSTPEIISSKYQELLQKRLNNEIHLLYTGLKDLDKLTGGFDETDLIIIAGRPSMGKCFGFGTKILMYDGTVKEVQNIKVNDLLMGNDSTPRRVLRLGQGREMMYFIKQNKAQTYRVNKSHILSLKASGTEGNRKHGEIINISLIDYLNKSKKFQIRHKGYKTSVEFPEKFLILEPYYLGLWIGDGTSTNANITNPDIEIKEYLNDYSIKRNEKLIKHKYLNRCENYLISGGRTQKARNNSIQSILRTMNLLDNKHIPNEYLINSKQNRLELLAGLLDADGYYQTGIYEISQKREDLIKQIKFLADSLGFRTSLTPKKVKCNGKIFDVWKLIISGNLSIIPTKIKRKICPQKEYKRNWQVTGIEVIQDKIDDYYGFEIDGNGLFLLDDMTVVHNTSLALSILNNISYIGQIPGYILSMEMSDMSLIDKMISINYGINTKKLRSGNLTAQEVNESMNFIEKYKDCKIYIDDTNGLNPFDIKQRAKYHLEKHGIKYIMIDYLGFIRSMNKTGTRNEKIGEITKELKNLAKQLKIPVILLVQMNRQNTQRGGAEGKRPELSDLRDSGEIEEDADIVLFVHRPEYYKILEVKNADNTKRSTVNIAELIIRKNRNGEVGTVLTYFDKQTTHFKNLEMNNDYDYSEIYNKTNDSF